MSARIMEQYGPAMCSVRSSTFTPSSGPLLVVSAMASGVSGDIARVAEDVGHRDLVEDDGEGADHAARGADAPRQERLVGRLHRLDGRGPVLLELGQQLRHRQVLALGDLAIVVGAVSALHGAGRRRGLGGDGLAAGDVDEARLSLIHISEPTRLLSISYA